MNAEPQRRTAKHLGHAWYAWNIGKRFCKSSCVFYSILSAGIESMEFSYVGINSLITDGEEWESNISSGSEMSVWTVSQKIHSSLVREILQRIMGADQQRLQISDLHFNIFPATSTFTCWKIRFKTEVCTCSQFPTKAMLWIKEVQMVDSVDDLKFSLSVKGIQMPNFAVLDARNASALNRIIHNSHFKKKKVSLEEQKPQKRTAFSEEDRSLFWSTSTSVTGANDSVENYADLIYYCLFEMTIFRNSIRIGMEFYLRWQKNSMTSWKDCTN